MYTLDNLEEKEDIEEDSSDNEEEVLDDDKESYAITQPEEGRYLKCRV